MLQMLKWLKHFQSNIIQQIINISKNFEVLCTFTPNKSYGRLLNVEPSNLVFLKTDNTELDEVIITFKDQNGRLLEIKDKVNLALLNKQK